MLLVYLFFLSSRIKNVTKDSLPLSFILFIASHEHWEYVLQSWRLQWNAPPFPLSYFGAPTNRVLFLRASENPNNDPVMLSSNDTFVPWWTFRSNGVLISSPLHSKVNDITQMITGKIKGKNFILKASNGNNVLSK